MLPVALVSTLQTFADRLRLLQSAVSVPNPETMALRTQFLEVQHFFQHQVMAVDASTLEPSLRSPFQSSQTEMNRQMRLLGVDVSFLQTARQPMTVQQRQAQICDRIATLLTYCHALTTTDQTPPSE